MDSDFETVNNYVLAIWKLDEATFSSLISDTAQITSTFNGSQVETINKKIFVERLHVGHFTNTTCRNMIKFSIEKVSTGEYNVLDICIMDREGKGKDESGPGKYYYDSHGRISVANGKIVKIDYEFKKTKMD